MVSSLGFGSTNLELNIYSIAVLLLAFANHTLISCLRYPKLRKSLIHYTRSTLLHDKYTLYHASTDYILFSLYPFCHHTSTLSVISITLGLEDGPPIFYQHFTCVDILIYHNIIDNIICS